MNVKLTTTMIIGLEDLKTQKQWLLQHQGDAVEGLLNLIDHIQDAIVDQKLANPDQVFAQGEDS